MLREEQEPMSLEGAWMGQAREERAALIHSVNTIKRLQETDRSLYQESIEELSLVLKSHESVIGILKAKNSEALSEVGRLREVIRTNEIALQAYFNDTKLLQDSLLQKKRKRTNAPELSSVLDPAVEDIPAMPGMEPSHATPRQISLRERRSSTKVKHYEETPTSET